MFSEVSFESLHVYTNELSINPLIRKLFNETGYILQQCALANNISHFKMVMESGQKLQYFMVERSVNLRLMRRWFTKRKRKIQKLPTCSRILVDRPKLRLRNSAINPPPKKKKKLQPKIQITNSDFKYFAGFGSGLSFLYIIVIKKLNHLT